MPWPGVVLNSDPRQITTPLVLVGLGLGVGEGLGLVKQVAISTRGGNNLAGVENGHNTGSAFCNDEGWTTGQQLNLIVELCIKLI